MRGLSVLRLWPRPRPRQRLDWVRGLPPEKARVLSRNLRLILDPGSVLPDTSAPPETSR